MTLQEQKRMWYAEIASVRRQLLPYVRGQWATLSPYYRGFWDWTAAIAWEICTCTDHHEAQQRFTAWFRAALKISKEWQS